MTVTHSAIYYHLSSTEDLDRLLSEIADSPAMTLIVSADVAAGFDLSTLDVARLQAKALNSEKRLILETDDEHESSMAMALGFDGVQSRANTLFEPGDPDDGIPENIDDDDELDVTALIELMQSTAPRPVPTFDTTADLATYRPDQPNESSPANGNSATSNPATVPPSEAEPGGESPPAEAANDDAGEALPSRHRELFSSKRPIPRAIRRPQQEAGSRVHPTRRPRSRQKPRRRRVLVVLMAVVTPIVVLALIGGFAAYYLPSAVVTLAPVEDTIAADLTYGVAVPGASLDISIDPILLSHRTEYESNAATTGERFEPDGTASGFVLFTNPFTNDVTIPSGTAIPGANGVTYYTFADVLIPKADPFGSLAFGSESAGVVAGVAGPDGNLEAGALTGQIATGLFYTNRDAISGGTNRRIAVVAEVDVASVEREIREALLADAEAEFLDRVPEGMQILPGTIEVGEPVIQISHSTGADATEISGSGSITVRARMFDPESLHTRANDEAGRRLASQAGADRILLANSVHLGDPIPLDPDGTSFVISASATVRAVITAEEQMEILGQLSGMRLTDVAALLDGHEKIHSYDVTIEPSWLPDRMPELGNRITVEVTTGDALRASR